MDYYISISEYIRIMQTTGEGETVVTVCAFFLLVTICTLFTLVLHKTSKMPVNK